MAQLTETKIFDAKESIYISTEEYNIVKNNRQKSIKTTLLKIFILLMLILSVAVSSCIAEEPKPPVPTQIVGKYHYSRYSGYQQKAYDVDYSRYVGKTIKRIYYNQHGGHSGDIMVTEFTDGTRLQVYAYKYTMEICY